MRKDEVAKLILPYLKSMAAYDVDKLAAQIDALYKVDGLREAVTKERDRVHAEINKMLEPLKLHLSWIASNGITSEQYGLADEDGDDIDFVTLFEPVLQQDTKDTCPHCNGSGMNEHQTSGVFCKFCDGSGINKVKE